MSDSLFFHFLRSVAKSTVEINDLTRVVLIASMALNRQAVVPCDPGMQKKRLSEHPADDPLLIDAAPIRSFGVLQKLVFRVLLPSYSDHCVLHSQHRPIHPRYPESLHIARIVPAQKATGNTHQKGTSPDSEIIINMNNIWRRYSEIFNYFHHDFKRPIEGPFQSNRLSSFRINHPKVQMKLPAASSGVSNFRTT